MFSKNELRYTLALQRVPYLGDATAKKLILKVGSAEGVFKERKKKKRYSMSFLLNVISQPIN